MPIFHIFKKRSKNFNIPILFLSFVDNRLFISQEKSFEKTNTFLFYNYNIILFLLKHFGLIIKHRKSEVIHFSRSHGVFNLLPLNLSPLREPILYLKKTWKYLRFIFNRKLSFWYHVNLYSNKVLSMVKYMKILGNSTKGLLPHQKQLLYRKCILLIVFYSFPLQYFNKALLLPFFYILSKNSGKCNIE